ncbi:MAG: alpha-1,2-fucosyltransferase [Chitinophagaceae bacterium]|nr:alpha-1,2-fucosyltransferase [Chitinophagaceae bacterium]
MQSENKIVIRVYGGLGNQLFIYSFARYISLVLKGQVYLEIYTGFVRDTYKRKYQLAKFNIQLQTCPWYLSMYFPLRNRLPLITRIIYGKVTLVNEQDFNLDPDLTFNKIQNSRLSYLEGYWQNSIFFREYESLLKSELSLKIKMKWININMASEMNQCNSVAIHFRRVQYDLVLQHDYYSASINQILTQIDNPHFFIFSDDIEWCKRTVIIEGTLTFVEHNSHDEISELWLMSQCKHFIVANSTFSWWGASLSANPQKIVIVPDSYIL